MYLQISKNVKDRQICLISDDYSLLFRTASKKLNGTRSEVCALVESVTVDQLQGNTNFDFSENFKQNNRLTSRYEGFMGLFKRTDGDIFLGLIKASKLVGHARYMMKDDYKTGSKSFEPSESIKQILDVAFISLTSNSSDIYENIEPSANGLPDNMHENVKSFHPCYELKKLFCDGTFYFSNEFDITNYLQNRGSEMFAHKYYRNQNNRSSLVDLMLEKFQDKYVWNIKMIEEMINLRGRISQHERERLDNGMFITFVIRGFAETKMLNKDLYMTNISRISIENKDETLLDSTSKIGNGGEISTFIESEMILSTPKYTMSYVICSGNIPLNYDLQESQFLIHSKKKLELTYSNDESRNLRLMSKHFNNLASVYKSVSCVNLTKFKDQGQMDLNSLYSKLVNKLDLKIKFLPIEIKKTAFKKITHQNYGLDNLLLEEKNDALKETLSSIKQNITEFGCFVYDNENEIFFGKQTGVIRLSSTSKNFIKGDRSSEGEGRHNVYLSNSGLNSIKKMILFSKVVVQEVFDMIFEELSLSKKFSHSLVVDNYEDKAIELFRDQTFQIVSLLSRNNPHHEKMANIYKRLFQFKLKLYDPLHSYVATYLKHNLQKKSISYKKNITIFAVTFNVSGVACPDDLTDLLFPAEIEKNTFHDIYCIGLEEAVDLTPGKMINTDATVKTAWAKTLLNTLNRSQVEQYALLGMQQLGGVIMLLFTKSQQLSQIKSIQYSFHKLGFGGIAANKGAVGISLEYSTTKFCFITSHLSAGLGNIEQRHIDYKMVNKNLCFGNKNLRIGSHDAIIWLGDLNFRINMSNEEAKTLISQKNYKEMLKHDQLHKQMSDGESFPFYEEMDIVFDPTYKFDKNTDIYDTSEKSRIPAWTDRILFKGSVLEQKAYQSIKAVKFSDHRPVFGIFEAKVIVLDEALKLNLINSIYTRLKKQLEHYDVQERLLILELAEKELIHSSKEKKTATSSKTIKAPMFNDEGKINTTDKIYLRRYYDNTNQKLPPPSNPYHKWWIGEANKPAVVDINVDSNEFVINPKKSLNPFEDNNDQPIFIRKS